MEQRDRPRRRLRRRRARRRLLHFLLAMAVVVGLSGTIVAGHDRLSGSSEVASVAGTTSTSPEPTSPEPTTIGPRSPPSTSTPTTTTTEASRPITIVATGDLLPHSPVVSQARADAGGEGHDFSPMLAGVRSVVEEADLAICHLETPLSRDGSDLSGFPTFNAPPELATAVAGSGYDACSVASNHSLDQGPDGVFATLDVLDGAGVDHAGAARSAEEAQRPRIYEVRGVSIGHLSYTYGLNGFERPADSPWLVNVIEPEAVLAEARAARAAGADLVVVSVHWGVEYSHEPSADQEQLASALLDAPEVDLILGHHAHVVQPIERRPDGKWVVFGMGNHLSNQSGGAGLPAATQDGLLVRATVTRGPDGSYGVDGIEYLPTYVDRPHRVVPAPPDSAARTEDVVRSRGAPVELLPALAPG